MGEGKSTLQVLRCRIVPNPPRKSFAARTRGRPRHDDVLTPAEWQVVNAIRHGLSNVRIARLRGISVDAVKFHAKNAIGKLGLKDRHALRHWRGVPKFSAVRWRRTTMTAAMTAVLGSIGQISRVVKDIKQAEQWYRDVLGLPHLYTYGKLAFFDCGGTRLFLSENSGETKTASIIYFKVADIQAGFDSLQARGVEFVGAPHMIHKHADGTEEWMAFFKDPEARMLAIMSQVKH